MKKERKFSEKISEKQEKNKEKREKREKEKNARAPDMTNWESP